jgi:hypothetical protein
MDNKSSHDLHVFMAQVSHEMSSEYDRIYRRASQDPGTAGDEGEQNWAMLLREWLPSTYHVETKGRLIGHDGTLSPQVDVLVLKPSYPRKLLEKKVWLAGGVAAAFECKTTITAAHIDAAVERSTRFKALYTERTGTPYRELRSPLFYGLLGHSHSWKGKGSEPLKNVENRLVEKWLQVPHPRLELDMICIADLATWNALYVAAYDAAWSVNKPGLESVFGSRIGPTTSIACGALSSDNQAPEFRPVGAFIALLTQKLAWEDPALRDIADYFRLTNLWGNAGGTIVRPWPLSIYSDTTRAAILAGRVTNDGAWSEWSLMGV